MKRNEGKVFKTKPIDSDEDIGSDDEKLLEGAEKLQYALMQQSNETSMSSDDNKIVKTRGPVIENQIVNPEDKREDVEQQKSNDWSKEVCVKIIIGQRLIMFHW